MVVFTKDKEGGTVNQKTFLMLEYNKRVNLKYLFDINKLIQAKINRPLRQKLKI